MGDNLKQKAAKGIMWKFLDQGGTQFIQFVTGIYIARLLSPDDYGLVGMMAIFLGISMAFIDGGFRYTLIQKGNSITQADYSTIFFFNIAISFFFYLLIYWGAPLIAKFYLEPRLTMIARVIGFNLIFMSSGLLHQTIFEKRINFKTISKINLIAIFSSVSSGIILAILGFGVWALVSMFLVESFVRTLLLWLINTWRPSIQFSIKSFKALLPMGSKLLFTGMLNQISLSIFPQVIGKLFTISDVGFYDQARKLQQRIGEVITNSIQIVLLPVQSLLKEDIPRLKNAVRTNVKITTLIAVPANLGLMAIAEPFVKLALTDKWLPSVYYIYILSLATFFFILAMAIGSYTIPIGKINFIVKYHLFSNILLLMIIGIGILFKVDLRVLVLGKVLQEFIMFLISIFFANRFIKYRPTEILIDIAPAVLISIFMSIAVYYLGQMFKVSFIVLFIQVIVGLIIYLGANYIFNRKLAIEIITLLWQLVKTQK